MSPSGTLYTLEAEGPLGNAGETFLLPHDEVMSPGVKAQAGWDFENLDAFAAHVQPDKIYTLIDIGANIGLFSRQLLRRVPTIQKILCVEPDPKNFNALKFNLAGLGNRVSFFNLALSSADGEADLLRDDNNIGNYSLNSDAMRNRSFDAVRVPTRETGGWMTEQLSHAEAILWKSDTQGLDEVIASAVPIDIWDRIDVAILEMWRIMKPDYDRDAFARRLESFPHRQLGEVHGVSVSDVIEYLSGDDWAFKDLLLWR
jgi:FkbM family methyltransferase